MSACNFVVPFSGNAPEILSKAKSAIQGQNGTFTGDETGGNFNLSIFGNVIEGSYTTSGQHLNIIIDSKPFLIPCSTIESFLKNKLK